MGACEGRGGPRAREMVSQGWAKKKIGPEHGRRGGEGGERCARAPPPWPAPSRTRPRLTSPSAPRDRGTSTPNALHSSMACLGERRERRGEGKRGPARWRAREPTVFLFFRAPRLVLPTPTRPHQRSSNANEVQHGSPHACGGRMGGWVGGWVGARLVRGFFGRLERLSTGCGGYEGGGRAPPHTRHTHNILPVPLAHSTFLTSILVVILETFQCTPQQRPSRI